MTKRLTKKQKEFLKAYTAQGGCNVMQACKQVNISRMTYYRWCDKSDTFVQKRDEAIEELYDIVESKLMKQIDNDREKSIHFYCETKMKHRGYTKSSHVALDSEKLSGQLSELILNNPD